MNQRNEYRIYAPSCYKTMDDGSHDEDDCHVFKIYTVTKYRKTWYEMSFDDTCMTFYSMLVPPELTDDKSLSDGDWLIACVKLLVKHERYPFSDETAQLLINDVIQYAAALPNR